ncbi:MAG TPA: RdgB/HAM1 family non-canonical purine NTP pyrophosphatase [Ignavibacteriaceae bacterium]|nr:RdgB/HAM1 family non-canonical purine NTP pyrophosphatase [Ignavibacteriaceae bacterium]
MTPKRILIATTNKGKMEDIREIFKDLNFEILSFLDFDNYPEVIEDGDTFKANAIKKARAAYDFFKIPVISDDSGLSVSQLNGAPGVISARYAGENATDEQNNNKLISELEKFPVPHLAKYICVAVYYNGTNLKVVDGDCKGRIIKQGRGSNGFGYDPYFIPDGYELTMGELSLQEKNKISHRLKAFEQLKDIIKKI